MNFNLAIGKVKEVKGVTNKDFANETLLVDHDNLVETNWIGSGKNNRKKKQNSSFKSLGLQSHMECTADSHF